MDKMKLKRHYKNITRDLNYYIKEYELSQKEAYEVLYENYYISMRLVQQYVEVEAREKIHNLFKKEE
nr:MAG TPA: hypothetical protein [Microviridae sp.]